MPASYPVPYTRLNQDHKARKTMQGFMNDSTLTNPSDPNTMQNVGYFRNSVYNAKVVSLPDGKRTVKTTKPADYGGKGPTLNHSFYRFGSKTNIQSSFQ